MKTTNEMNCPKCGGEMKEINKDTLKCEHCGEIVRKNQNAIEEKEDTTKS